jgi:hypothetical protein
MTCIFWLNFSVCDIPWNTVLTLMSVLNVIWDVEDERHSSRQPCQLELSERFFAVKNFSHTKCVLFCNWMKQTWLAFCRMFFEVQNYYSDNTVHILMSDEAHFHFPDLVNEQYFWYWSRDNPCEMHQQCPPHSQRVTIWCIISIACIIGPYHFWK